MVKQTGSYIIQASPEEVFRYMDDSTNAAKATPSLGEAHVRRELPNGGKEIAAKYELGGIVSGKLNLKAVEYEPFEKITFEISGDIEGRVRWTFKEHNNGATLFEYDAEFNPDIPAPNFMVDKVASYLNQKEVDEFVENLREELE